MKFLITEPRVPGTFLSRQLIAHWNRVTRGHNLEFYTNLPYEVHGELLTRLWTTIRYGPPDIYLISETDMVLKRSFVKKLATWPWPENLIMVPFITRKVIEGQPVILEHEGQTGAWFMAFNLTKVQPPNWPPLDWLSYGGVNNDAANNALNNAGPSGFVDSMGLRLLDWEDSYPPLLSIKYPACGIHLFFARHYHEDFKKPLIPDFPYTVGDHVQECLKYLAREELASNEQSGGKSLKVSARPIPSKE